ncbi:HAMP domain-containing sensor histidine kinase [Bacteroides sp. 519]|uniref:sensor histidine kinase n=1 Tax=Bacteroides sp. 519 TaxID=2302937 RepID=UPI0013D1D6AB|nr:HAMP domain-containing sensor histidine kinase [Bacteroides sp. 519]NDV58140.1 sensor histidine kinase [Bacteroides sp. 519]
MKLLHYTYWKLLLFLLLILTGWGILFYYTIIEEVTDETDDSLENYQNILINMALDDPTILNTTGNIMTLYQFRPISDVEAEDYKTRFYDSTVYIQTEDEHEPVRVMMSCFRMPDGQYYELELKISTLEREDMIEAIFAYLISLFILLFISLMLITRIVLKKSFNPLDKLMDWLRKIQPGKEVPELNNETTIKEFQELSKAAIDMSNRSFKAYQQQKQFIENASHELQTPLAIVRNKIELLVQDGLLNEKQMEEIDSIYTTLGRVVKLNQSLLLLSRIENKQYDGMDDVDINKIIEALLPDLTDVYEEKRIRINYAGNDSFIIKCNEYLAQILVTNLLKNALSHSKPNGEITIETNTNGLIIKNSGDAPLERDKIFQRFYHPQTENKESLGLGLSIAQTIAASYNLVLEYKWQGMHCFSLHRAAAQ